MRELAHAHASVAALHASVLLVCFAPTLEDAAVWLAEVGVNEFDIAIDPGWCSTMVTSVSQLLWRNFGQNRQRRQCVRACV